MRPERWKRIQELFDAAVALQSEARDHFLERSCRDDPSLRLQVEGLIRHSHEAGSFIRNAVAGSGAWERQADSLTGRTIGPYHVQREIGRGGMGAVYLAERADAQFQKKVAVKLMRRGLDSPEMRQRFLNERQILADLDHPNVARLLDGGTTEGGVPFVVMEYVDGERIDEYCDRNGLDTAERVRLFLKVCEAVEFAHRNLVVHRDLKPGNILVTAEGQPKLLDFGIAKLLRPELATHTVPLTESVVRVMTPEYASPEQVRGETITTASDVYSLGVLLYELLGGRPPYRLEHRTFGELMRVICEQDPERPSTATEPLRSGDRRRDLVGDLDNIILMAMRKEPEQRYASVGHLAEDLRRHLEGLPVTASQQTWRYRTGKFVRRNKVAVAAATIIFTLLVGFSAAMSWQAVRISDERDRVVREREKSDEISTFLTELFRLSDPREAPGEAVTARELLDRARERIDRELRDQPETRAEMLDTLGVVYTNLALFDDAAELLEQAAAERRALLGDDHPDTLASVYHLGVVRTAQARWDEAESLLQEVLEAQQRSLGDHPDTARTLAALGDLYHESQRPEAYRSYKQAFELQKRVLGPDHPETLRSQYGLAWQLWDAGIPVLVDVLERQRRVLGDDHPDTLDTMGRLADKYWANRRYEDAERLYRESLEIRRHVLGPDHPRTLVSQNGLILVYPDLGRYDEAEALALETLDAWRRAVGEDHPRVLRAIAYVGRVHEKAGRPEIAADWYARALAAQRRILGDRHPDTLNTKTGRAEVLFASGHRAEAISLAEEALRGWGPAGRGDKTQDLLVKLAGFAVAEGRFEDAIDRLAEACDRGLNAPERLDDERRLDPIRSHPDFEAVVASVRRRHDTLVEYGSAVPSEDSHLPFSDPRATSPEPFRLVASSRDGRLFSLDAGTGRAKEIGDSGHEVLGPIAFVPSNGGLYGITDGDVPSLTRIDPATARATIIGPLQAPGFGRLQVRDVAGRLTDGSLYASISDAAAPESRVVRIDPKTAEITAWLDIEETYYWAVQGIADVVSLEWLGDEMLISEWNVINLPGLDQIYRVDPGTGIARRIGSGDYKMLWAWEPSSATLFALDGENLMTLSRDGLTPAIVGAHGHTGGFTGFAVLPASTLVARR